MPVLTRVQLEEFQREGYLLIDGLFDPAETLDPILEEYAGVLHRLAEKLQAAGELASAYRELPFGDRVIRMYAETGKTYEAYFDFSLPRAAVKKDSPIWVGPAVFRTLINSALLDVVESVIGPEILANPVQHIRIKPPERLVPASAAANAKVVSTPWHQDSGVFEPEADETDMLTVWFPLVDATVENGCLRVIPRSHTGGLITHCPTPTRGPAIPDTLLDSNLAITIPMRRGDVLLIHKKTCHSSLPNVSDEVRISFDLRYHPIGQPTGRNGYPGFVARSRANPEKELRDPIVWADLWYEAREELAANTDEPVYDRWDSTHPGCA